MSRALEVIAPGPLTLIEDLGRPGLAHLGVGPSGAADRTAYLLGNRLVGNPAGHAALEVTYGGLHVRARGALTVCVTGATAPITLDSRPADPGTPLRVPDGADLVLGMPSRGLRSYLAVRGGIAVAPVLGSRSTDTLAEIGTRPLSAGDVLPIGPPPVELPHIDHAPARPWPQDALVVLPGPRRDWFADPNALRTTSWVVGSASDRRGVRLTGAALARVPSRRHTELASEGMVRGAIQVPPNGQPVILLADHPVTGGYPVLGVLTEESADRAAQLVPGSTLRLTWASGRHSV